MTPREKATELVNKMLYNSCEPHYDDYSGDLYKVHLKKSKQCALIAVDEIINAYPLRPQRTPGPIGVSNARTYWQQVKEEIEKL